MLLWKLTSGCGKKQSVVLEKNYFKETRRVKLIEANCNDQFLFIFCHSHFYFIYFILVPLTFSGACAYHAYSPCYGSTNKHIDLMIKTTTLDFFLFFLVHFISSFLQCKWLTVICKTTRNETTWKSVLCIMKICFKKWWQKVATWMPCCLDRKIRVTNGHCAHCDFFVSMSRDKELALRAVSTSYIFDLQQSIWKSFSLK